MPPEWAPHAATWLVWPHNLETWPTRLASVQRTWIEMIKALHVHEEVRLLVNDEAMEKEVRHRLDRADIDFKRVKIHKIPTNDCWLRDTGPTFVKSPPPPFVKGGQGGISAVTWTFNSWGEKWPPWDLDSQVASRIAEAAATPSLQPGIILEGGSIEVNGEGLLLTTESCLLHPKRNQKLGKEGVEKILKEFLGVKKILWLRGTPLEGDDTDGHIDNIARFVSPRHLVVSQHHDFHDPQLKLFEVTPLPFPRVIGPDGKSLPASYANFYIANNVVLVPTFGVSEDDEALKILRPLFPERRVVPIRSNDLVLGFGGVHCVTQQQPA